MRFAAATARRSRARARDDDDAAAAQVRALEDRMVAVYAERAPGRGADDAVGGQAVRALEVLDGARGARARTRRRPRSRGGAAAATTDGAATLDPGATAGPAGAARGARRAMPWTRRQVTVADDPVDGQAVAALEAADGLVGALAEDAVGGGQAEVALEDLDADTMAALLQRLGVGGCGGGGAGDDERRHGQGGQESAGCGNGHGLRRLRGELSGSRRTSGATRSSGPRFAPATGSRPQWVPRPFASERFGAPSF